MEGIVQGRRGKGFKGIDTGMDLGYPHAEEIPKGVEGQESKTMGARIDLFIITK